MSKLKQEPARVHATCTWPDEEVGPVSTYDRMRDLPRLAYVELEECHAAERSVAGHLRLLSKIDKALRRERRNGRSGAWPYDPGRHRGLAAAVREEARLLRSRLGKRPH